MDIKLTQKELNFLMTLIEKNIPNHNINLLHKVYKKLLIKYQNINN